MTRLNVINEALCRCSVRWFDTEHYRGNTELNGPGPATAESKTRLDFMFSQTYTKWHIQGGPDPMLVPSPSSRPREAKLFRNNRSQAVRIPVEFELPGDRVLIRREGEKLIIEPIPKPANIRELLAAWRQEPPLGPEDEFPDIDDRPATPETTF